MYVFVVKVISLLTNLNVGLLYSRGVRKTMTADLRLQLALTISVNAFLALELYQKVNVNQVS